MNLNEQLFFIGTQVKISCNLFLNTN